MPAGATETSPSTTSTGTLIAMSTDVADTTSPSGSAPLADSSTPTTPLELKKDGTASRMRLHKGNIPTVPQTKSCPMCPAKFTRTTHLSRHLRTRK